MHPPQMSENFVLGFRGWTCGLPQPRVGNLPAGGRACTQKVSPGLWFRAFRRGPAATAPSTVRCSGKFSGKFDAICFTRSLLFFAARAVQPEQPAGASRHRRASPRANSSCLCRPVQDSRDLVTTRTTFPVSSDHLEDWREDLRCWYEVRGARGSSLHA